jgi:hypothetical protein
MKLKIESKDKKFWNAINSEGKMFHFKLKNSNIELENLLRDSFGKNEYIEVNDNEFKIIKKGEYSPGRPAGSKNFNTKLKEQLKGL